MRTVKTKPIHPKPPRAKRLSFTDVVQALRRIDARLEEQMAVSTLIVAAQAALDQKIADLAARVAALNVLSPADEQAIADGLNASGAKLDAIAPVQP